MFKIAAIINLGTTLDPIKYEIDKLAEEYGCELQVIIAYGKPFSGQYPNPFELASEAVKYIRDKGFHAEAKEISEVEDLDKCIYEYRTIIEDLVNKGVSSLVVDYTGGTKVMSAALVYSALTSNIEGEVDFRYIGGEIRDRNGRVIRDAMEFRATKKTLIAEKVKNALEAARSFDYYKALSILGEKGLTGRYKFIKDAMEFLHLWDTFRYSDAEKKAEETGLRKRAEVLVDDEQLDKLSRTVLNLTKISRRLSSLVNNLVNVETGQSTLSVIKDIEGFMILSLDALENARRRMMEERFTDVALRSYRSIEVASQAVLILKYKLSPWAPDWHNLGDKLGAIREVLGALPEKISLETALKIIHALDNVDLLNEFRIMANIRNHSYLEHGYQKTTEKSAKKALGSAEVMVYKLAGLLGIDNHRVKNLEEQLKHII